MPVRWWFLIGSLVLLIALAAGFASAGDRLVRAVYVKWEPYGFLSQGKAAGFELDAFSVVMKKMNRPVEFRQRPWKRCLYMVEHGLADAVISALKTPEREKYLFYPDEHISINQTSLFTLAGRVIKFSGSYRELQKYIIGATSGFSYGSAFDKADYLQKDENTTTEAIVTKLLMGRIDIGIGNLAVISSIARKMGVGKKIDFLTPLVHSSKLYVGFSKKTVEPRFVKAFSRELKALKMTKAYGAILAKYGVPHDSQAH